jgi:hypothetical protein
MGLGSGNSLGDSMGNLGRSSMGGGSSNGSLGSYTTFGVGNGSSGSLGGLGMGGGLGGLGMGMGGESRGTRLDSMASLGRSDIGMGSSNSLASGWR